MFQHAFSQRVEGVRMAGAAVVNAAQFRVVPEEEVNFDNVLNVDKVTGLLAVAITVETV